MAPKYDPRGFWYDDGKPDPRQAAADAARQAGTDVRTLLEQYQQGQQGRFPGHPPNAASVSPDGLKSYDAQGYELDSLGNRAFGGWPGDNGGGGPPGAGATPPWQWGNATGAPTPWWLPGLGGTEANPWGAVMQAMGMGAPPAAPTLAQQSMAQNMARPGADMSAPAVPKQGLTWEEMIRQQYPNLEQMPQITGTPAVQPAPVAGPVVPPTGQAPPPTYPPGMTPQPGIPNWAQPNYDQSPFQGLNEEQWRRNLEAAAGLYFPLMNYMQGADQFNRTLAEQQRGNRWSEGFQDRTWNSEFGEGQRRYNQDFGESARRYGLDFGEAQRRFNTELDQRKREAQWQRTADAYNITGRAVLPRARYVSY